MACRSARSRDAAKSLVAVSQSGSHVHDRSKIYGETLEYLPAEAVEAFNTWGTWEQDLHGFGFDPNSDRWAYSCDGDCEAGWHEQYVEGIYTIEDGKLERAFYTTQDGDSDYADSYDLNDKEAAKETESWYGVAGFFDASLRYAVHVAQTGDDPLGFYAESQAESHARAHSHELRELLIRSLRDLAFTRSEINDRLRLRGVRLLGK